MFASFPPRPSFRLVIPVFIVLAILVSVLAYASAHAAPNAPTFTVNSTLDAVDAHPGDGICATSGNLCTLRAAIMEANHTSGGGATITVPAGPKSYQVAIPASGPDDETTGDLNLTANMSIVGKPSRLYSTVIIDAAIAHDRVFHIITGIANISNISSITNGQAPDYGGGIYNQGTLYLTNSTVISNTSGSDGGGIVNAGTATLTNSTVSGNKLQGPNAAGGGGIWNYGVATLNNSTFIHNVAINGGGVYNQGTLTIANGTITLNNAINGAGILTSNKAIITHSVISQNTADFTAGGVYNQGALTLTNSTVSGNTNNTNDAGGIENDGTATLTNDTLSGNTSTVSGGGIFNRGELTLTNSTLSGNTAAFAGGGIYNFDGLGTLKFVTLSGNSAHAGAGDLEQDGTIYTETLTLLNTIVAGSSAGTNCDYSGIPLDSQGYNLSSDGSCPFIRMGDLNNANPKLGPLANNGGSTQTLALLSGSPALDKIPSGTNGCGTSITSDQRGSPRPVNGKCDIGAYEASGAFAPPTPTPVPTAIPCAGKPAAPTLLTPANGKQIGKPRVALTWSSVACATKFKVVVDENIKGGVRVDSKKVTTDQYKTIALPAGKTYFWRVKACDAAGCTLSVWFDFKRKS